MSDINPSKMIKRYRDAYCRVATAAVAFASLIKILCVVVAIITCIGLLIVSGQQGRIAGYNTHSLSGPLFVAAFSAAVLSSIPFYLFAILISAVGQNLRASLDTAVHTSTFLDADQKRQAMGLK